MQKYRRFTLVELISVVAVLVVLLSLLAPNLQKSLNVAKDLSCKNNLRVVGLSTVSYLEDFYRYMAVKRNTKLSTMRGRANVVWDDLLGLGYDGRDLSYEELDAAYFLKKNYDSVHLYQCPYDTIGWREVDLPHQRKNPINLKVLHRTYSMNNCESLKIGYVQSEEFFKGVTGFASKGIGGYPKGISKWSAMEHQIFNPSKMITMTESPELGILGGGDNNTVYNIKWQDGSVRASRGYKPLNIRYHQGGYMYLFADGHVANLLPEETMGPGGTLRRPKGLWTRFLND